MEGFASTITDAITSHPHWALPLAFLGGLLTAANPCVLVMVPLMLAFISAQGMERKNRGRRIASVLLFTLGLVIAFTLFGLAAVGIGSLSRGFGDISTLIAAIICWIVALHLFDIVRWQIPLPERVKRASTGWFGALILGSAFGFVSIPCATPILAVLLAFIAASSANVASGFTMLLFYALGHCGLVVAAGLSLEIVNRIVGDTRIECVNLILRRVSGAIFALAGFYLLLS